MPKSRKSRLTVSIESFCEALIETNYYQKIDTTPKIELLRLVALKVYKASDSVAKTNKNRVNVLSRRCELFLLNNQKEIDTYFSTHFNGSDSNFPTKFSLNFEFSDILNNNNTFNHNLRNNVFQKFTTINSSCILTCKYRNIKVNKPFVVLKFSCNFPNCPATYHFTLNNDFINNECDLNFTIKQNGPILHQKGVDKARFINKDKRKEIGNKLIEGNISPEALYYDLLSGIEISDDMLDKEDDIKKLVPSKSVLRQIKYETLKNNKLDQDPFIELIKFKKLQENEKNYFIKEIHYSPLRVFLFHDSMYKVIKKEIEINKFLDIHLDCTGSLFQKYTEKRAFYYSIALPSIKNNSSLSSCPQISIYDGILADHTTCSIKSWLEHFIKLIEKKNRQNTPSKKSYCRLQLGFLTCLS